MTKKLATHVAIFLLLANNLSAARLKFSDDEILAQEERYPSNFPFYDALQIAIDNFMENDDDDESFKSLMIEKYSDLARVKEEIWKIINSPSTVVELQAISDPKAPLGEDIAQNWIFSFRVKNFDHTFYAIINRFGEQEPYVYGFN